MKIFSVFLHILLVIFVFSCKPTVTNTTEVKSTDSVSTPEKKWIALVSPSENSQFNYGSKVTFKVQILDSTKIPDSVCFQIDGKIIKTTSRVFDTLVWDSKSAKLGYQNAEIIAYSGGSRSYDRKRFFLKNTQEPTIYSYKIVKVYPHDKTSYTQGLVYDNAGFYEGTGVYGESTLRKTELQSGNLLKVVSLPENVFGEGIAVFDNKILQISWQEQVAFLYEKETFRLLTKYYYPMKEGWGLTYDGTHLIMSDGSSTLYFLDKEYFTQVNKIDVYDTNGPVYKLNELEFINGEIWANVYTTDTIVRINPSNGAVTGKIILSGLLSAEEHKGADVLNGIAYDPDQNRLFVTGKYWPKIFQISIFASGK